MQRHVFEQVLGYVTQGMLNFRGVNQMERCGAWELRVTVDDLILGNFKTAVHRDFANSRLGTFPKYPNTFSIHAVLLCNENARDQFIVQSIE